MPGPHDEFTFETAIVAGMVTVGGWQERPAGEYDRKLRLLPADLEAFLTATQPDAVEQLQARLGDGWARKTAEYVAKGLKRPGDTIKLLRGGKTIHGVDLDLAYFKPTHDLVPENVARYKANVLTVVRQVPYSPDHGNTLDIGLFVNGIPVADAEVKNGSTQKTADAVDQYRTDRDPKDEFLARRSVVHFAVDPDTVMMTSRLEGPDTRFLPFNRGSEPDGQGGAGNYMPADGSHKTSYLWREVWQRDAWLDLLQQFIHVQQDPDDPTMPPSLTFPRLHQWDLVHRLTGDARQHGAGRNYLVMHSTGAGKSNEIGWLAHRLANLYDTTGTTKVFDKVVVVTDRRVLDRALQDTIEQFELKSAKGMVQTITKGSKQLREALKSKTAKIIVTTIQTFPHVVRGLDARHGSRYAVIIDEAHSSQSGDYAGSMKLALTKPTGEPVTGTDTGTATLPDGTGSDGEPGEPEDVAAQMAELVAAARGKQDDLSMFAFTATPKARTLELFGTRQPDGTVRPFHLYSMRQAIEEGFIMDVLANYMTYKTYYRLATDAGDVEVDSSKVEKSKALSAARRFATLHPYNIAQKVQVIVEHFREHVQDRIGGQAKAMIVTSSRLHAVRYKRTIDKYLAEKGYDDLKTLIAFSGTVHDPDVPGEDFTEPGMNGFAESLTAKRFATPEYQVMVVAEKYQTGFSERLLHTMYVDKSLTGITAVQTLGRLNRTHPLKDDTFVLDFVNDVDTISQAFSDYYGDVQAPETDPQALYEAWDHVDDLNVIEDDDVAAFATIWFDPSFDPRSHLDKTAAGAAAATGNAGLFAALKPAEERFADLTDDAQEQFRDVLRGFVRMYAFLSQVLSYADSVMERRYAYARMLSHRIAKERGTALDLSDTLRLSHYKLDETFKGRIDLTDGGELPAAFPGGGIGPLTEEEYIAISDVVERINDVYGQNLTEAHKLLVGSLYEWMTDDADLQQKAGNNPKDKFLLSAKPKFEAALFAHLDDHTDLVKAFIENPHMQEMLVQAGLEFVYRRANEKYNDQQQTLPLTAPTDGWSAIDTTALSTTGQQVIQALQAAGIKPPTGVHQLIDGAVKADLVFTLPTSSVAVLIEAEAGGAAGDSDRAQVLKDAGYHVVTITSDTPQLGIDALVALIS